MPFPHPLSLPALFDDLTEILDPEPHEAALNMAIDDVLLRGANAPLLRVYRWARPAVSFGYFGDYGAVSARWPGWDLVRRWTGGGEVPHGTDCTYTLVVPRAHAFCRQRAEESYRLIHQHVAGLLAAAAVTEEAAPQISAACFENPVRFDVLSGGRKIAGAAQRRTVHGLLHQGSIADDTLPESFPVRLAASLASQIRRRALTPDELNAAQALAREKYGSSTWLDRRAHASYAGTKL